jgi:hypothetical protein
MQGKIPSPEQFPAFFVYVYREKEGIIKEKNRKILIKGRITARVVCVCERVNSTRASFFEVLLLDGK